ncbi:MAG TPA: cellulase family glycosylhydrolase [Chloroflexaceae bacterium]|nr:cellulase family glycosylhydrolase [Chloroflexaceae bacterium]
MTRNQRPAHAGPARRRATPSSGRTARPSRLGLALGFLALLILLTGAAAPRPAAAIPAAQPLTGPVGPPSFGLNSHLATRYPDPSSMDVPAAMVSELGVAWVREDFHWHRVQPRPEVWDWTFTDAAMRALLSRGVNVLGVLGPSVGWATPYGADTPNDVSYHAPDPDAFVEYVRGVVTRYRRYVNHWEIWNEPDHPYFWRPAPDPAAYTAMLVRAAAVIREVDPDAQILVGGFNPYDTTFLRAVAEYGGWGSFDILAIHPYVDPYSPEDGNLAAAADGVRALAGQYGEKPIWATEVGWASGPGDRDAVGRADEEDQASYLVRAMLSLWEAGVERSFWYSYKDDPGNPYGLIRLGSGRTDYSQRKPAFEALRTLNQQLAGATYVTRRDLFERRVLVDFEAVRGWRRVSQPNGSLRPSMRARGGQGSAELSYNFTTRENDYVAFEREQPIPLPGRPYAVGAWVYGDGSTHGVKVWIRDAEGEVLQFVLGPAGAPGWHFLRAPIGGEVEPGNVIVPGGNRRVDFPAALQAIVLDDLVDGFVGSGTIWIDDLSVISGHEVYDLRLERGGEALDILWSPPGARVTLATRAEAARLVERGGAESALAAQGGRLRVNLGPAPVYLWHRR